MTIQQATNTVKSKRKKRRASKRRPQTKYPTKLPTKFRPESWADLVQRQHVVRLCQDRIKNLVNGVQRWKYQKWQPAQIVNDVIV